MPAMKSNAGMQGVGVIRTQLQYVVSTGVLLQAVRNRSVTIDSITVRSFQPSNSPGVGTDDMGAGAPANVGARAAAPHTRYSLYSTITLKRIAAFLACAPARSDRVRVNRRQHWVPPAAEGLEALLGGPLRIASTCYLHCAGKEEPVAVQIAVHAHRTRVHGWFKALKHPSFAGALFLCGVRRLAYALNPKPLDCVRLWQPDSDGRTLCNDRA